ncbi:MAG: heparinase II/III family protein, partial [Phycisphaeraceae bacterium]
VSMLWLARRYNEPACTAFRKRYDRAHHPLDLIWLVPDASLVGESDHVDALAGDDDDIAALPLDRHFKSAEAVTMRTTWHDESASFVGFGAVDNKAGHPMLDQGSFVFDALGQRWAMIFKSDDYNAPGYFDTKQGRWRFYRTRAEGHNTLVLNPSDAPDQDPQVAGEIIKVTGTPDSAAAVADISAAYAHAARSVKRGVALVAGRRALLVQDEIEVDKPCDLWWFMHTMAVTAVGDEGRRVTLTQADEQVTAQILGPADARFEVVDAKPLPSSPVPARQEDNAGVAKLAIHLPAFAGGRLRVLLSPGKLELEVPEKALDAW